MFTIYSLDVFASMGHPVVDSVPIFTLTELVMELRKGSGSSVLPDAF